MGFLAVADLLLEGGVLHLLHVITVDRETPQEERIAHVCYRCFELEYRHVARQGRDIRDVPAFQIRDERAVDILIAYAVRNDIEPCVHQSPGLFQVKQMRRDPEPMFVGLLDDRTVHLRRHVGHLRKAGGASGS